MATTWVKPIHKLINKSVVATLAERIGYADNPNKTDSFEYVESYGCDYYTAANEFALSKQVYENHTGRGGCNGDIIAYHVRQSFKPGEISPQDALEVGYALAEKFTHGNHAFVCAVHTDRHHIHCHIVFNAVNIDCDRKFRNPLGSMKIVRRISDFLCAERGLSIVENPKPSKGCYRDWQDKKEPQTNKDKLRDLIDINISAGMVFEQFIAAMSAAGCEAKRGKYLSFKIPGAERFVRVKSIGDDYTEQALRERCMGKRPAPKRDNADGDAERKAAEYAVTQKRPSLLIDIQEKIREGAGDGYVQWMRIFNLKTAARTLIFLKEHGIDSYDELCEKSEAASTEFHTLNERLKEIGDRQKQITELQKQIGTYSKTKNIFNEYRRLKKYQQTKWEQFRNARHPADVFYDDNSADITLCQAAKNYFDEQGFKGKLPTIDALKREWATLDAERRKFSPRYKPLKEKYLSICTAKANADVILFGSRQPQKSHDRDAR